MCQQLPQIRAMLLFVSWWRSTYFRTSSCGLSGGPVCIPLRFGKRLIETWATKASCSLEYLWPRTLGKAAISLGVRGAGGISLDLGLNLVHGRSFILVLRMISVTLVIIVRLSRASDPTAWRLPKKLVVEMTSFDRFDVASNPGQNCSAALHKVRWRSPGAPTSLAV